MDIIEKEWSEANHPRVPAGTAAGGQFSGGGKGPSVGGGEGHDNAGPGKPFDDIKDPLAEWGNLDPDHRRRGRQFFVGSWINEHDPKIPTDEAKERAGMEWDALDDKDKAAWARGAQAGREKVAERNWEKVPDNQKEMVRENWAKDWAARNQAEGQSTERAMAIGREHFDNQGDEAKMDHFNRMDSDEFVAPEKPLAPGLPTDQLGQEPRAGHPEGGVTEQPEPEQEPFTTGAEPEKEEDAGPTPTPEEWEQLNGKQQDRAKQAWKQHTEEDFQRDNVDQWREDDSNFEQIPGEIAEDQGFGEETIKDINNGFYPGERPAGIDDSGGGSPEAHDEENRRAAEWRDHFAMDDSFQNGAFSWDDEGNLSVDTDKLVFKDNPHEGPGAEQQQLIPGVDREEMSNAYKKAEWAKVNDTFENEFKGKFEEEVEKRTDHLKENPPDYLYDVSEYQDEAWDNMDDREKFNHAKDYLSTLQGRGGDDDGGGGGRGEGVSGTVGPSKEDDAAQKAIQKKEPVSKKNLGGGVSESKIVTMSDGSKYVWKPSTGEADVRSGIAAGVQYQREVAAYDIGKLVGLKDNMPVSSIMKYEGQNGVMMQMIPHAHNDGTEGDKDFENTALKATAFDFVIGNTDRHGANWMSDDNGKLWLIDHGLSFSTGGDSIRFGLWSSAVNNTNLDSEIQPEIQNAWKGKWPKIEAILERRHIESDAVEAAKERYDILVSKGATWQDIHKYGD